MASNLPPIVPRSPGLVNSSIVGRTDNLPADLDGGSTANMQFLQDDTYSVSVYAHMLEADSHVPGRQAPKPGNDRGPIVEFSRKARKRMISMMNKIRDFDATKAWFLTLTYPGEFTHDARQVKEHIKSLFKRIRRRQPGVGMVWRLELKPRLTGASQGEIVPHYHVILFNVIAKRDAMIASVSKAWNEIVDGDADHLAAGTNVRRIASFRHLLNYVSKYAAKTDEIADANTLWGKRWGIMGVIDRSALHTFRLSRRAYVEFRRLMRSWLKSKGYRRFFGLDGSDAYRRYAIFGLGDEDDPTAALDLVGHARDIAHDKQRSS